MYIHSGNIHTLIQHTGVHIPKTSTTNKTNTSVRGAQEKDKADINKCTYQIKRKITTVKFIKLHILVWRGKVALVHGSMLLSFWRTNETASRTQY